MTSVETFANTASNNKTKRMEVLTRIGKAQIVVGSIDLLFAIVLGIVNFFWFGTIIQIVLGLYMIVTGVLVCRHIKHLSRCKVITHLVLTVIGVLGYTYFLVMYIIHFTILFTMSQYHHITEGWSGFFMWSDALIMLSELILYFTSTIITSQVICCTNHTIDSYYQVEMNLPTYNETINQQVISSKQGENEKSDELPVVKENAEVLNVETTADNVQLIT